MTKLSSLITLAVLATTATSDAAPKAKRFAGKSTLVAMSDSGNQIPFIRFSDPSLCKSTATVLNRAMGSGRMFCTESQSPLTPPRDGERGVLYSLIDGEKAVMGIAPDGERCNLIASTIKHPGMFLFCTTFDSVQKED